MRGQGACALVQGLEIERVHVVVPLRLAPHQARCRELGQVVRDSRIPLTQDLRVLEAITQAGGFTTFADKNDVRIVRRQLDGAELEYRFDYNAYIRGRAPGTNIRLHPGDTIIVPD